MYAGLLKEVVTHENAANQKILDRLCIRARIPSLRIDVEHQSRLWSLKMHKAASWNHVKKVKENARDALESI